MLDRDLLAPLACERREMLFHWIIQVHQSALHTQHRRRGRCDDVGGGQGRQHRGPLRRLPWVRRDESADGAGRADRSAPGR